MNQEDKVIRVVELFAGVGGFRIGLERASSQYKIIWSNQWEPSTVKQDASDIYITKFGSDGHSNEDIAKVPTSEIPECDMIVGGFPCQDYSVATTLHRSGGIEGKKGVLWWEIYRIINETKNKPNYLLFENVDRLLSSPASQRGRDFAIILSSLSKLGYAAEWRVINAADYGMPQRRKRTYIMCYYINSPIYQKIISSDKCDWLLSQGVIANAFPVLKEYDKYKEFVLSDDIAEISDNFNKQKANTPFCNTGIMVNGHIVTMSTTPNYTGVYQTLGSILVDDSSVPNDYYITDEYFPKWKYLKGSKKFQRTSKDGHEYTYSEGGVAFPDYLDRPSRTIITGEGGKAPSRFKHVIKTNDGRYRRLLPIELERLNMFPDNHTEGVSDTRRAFLMGNALVTGIVEKIGKSLLNKY